MTQAEMLRLHLQYKMFLLNLEFHQDYLLQLPHLQYKMFLLNRLVVILSPSFWKAFTIQNVPIKYILLEPNDILFPVFTIQNVPIK